MDGATLRADWPAPPGVVAFTTLRHGAGVSAPPFDSFNLGARCGDEPAAIAANRAELIARFGLPAEPCWLQQVHGTRVVRFFDASTGGAAAAGVDVDAPAPSPATAGEGGGEGARRSRAKTSEADCVLASPPPQPAYAGEVTKRSPVRSPASPTASATGEQEVEADAAVTAEAGVVLAILSADCLPVLFCAEDGREVGAAHAGWRGLAAGVLENTIAAMHTPPARLLAWLGPAAGAQAYEIGADVRDTFLARDAGAGSAFVPTRPGHWRVDLYALARRRLAAAGVTRVFGGGLCTISDPARFYSHRRDGRSGRMATVIWHVGAA